LKPDTNLRIIGIEVVGLGTFILFLTYLELTETNNNATVVSFAWVFGIVAITLILVGLETISVVRRLKSQTLSKIWRTVGLNDVFRTDVLAVLAISPPHEVLSYVPIEALSD
jgi:hypothetical protein